MFGLYGIVYRLPKEVPSSRHIKGQAIAYYYYLLNGNKYYAPLTKESKKLFGFKIRKGKIVFENYMQERRLENYLRIVTDQLLLQIRDTVGVGVYKQLDSNIKEGLEKMYKNELSRRIVKGIEVKLLKKGDDNGR